GGPRAQEAWSHRQPVSDAGELATSVAPIAHQRADLAHLRRWDQGGGQRGEIRVLYGSHRPIEVAQGGTPVRRDALELRRRERRRWRCLTDRDGLCKEATFEPGNRRLRSVG